MPLAAFIAIEGTSSLLMLAGEVASTGGPRIAEESSTTYDAEIGWVARKSFTSPDLYGPGISLHTNARGFRGSEEIDDPRPAGRRRVVCLGDSFTLGYGVADDQTWCANLATPQLQAVNMGQGAYGIDQAYLWYRRDARTMEHDLQVLAFITDDFRRMGSDRFLTFAKPRLVVQGDSLVVEGVPVPRARRVSWKDRLLPAVRSLRSAQLVGRLTRRSQSARGSGDIQGARQTGETKDLASVVAHVVAELARLNAAKGSTLLLVYLPVDTDFQNEASAPWRAAMRTIADSLKVPLLDLIPEQRKLDRQRVRALYIRQQNSFAGSAGHLTVEGNRWAAEHIRVMLDSLESASARSGR